MNTALGWTTLFIAVAVVLGAAYWWQYAHGVAVIIK